MSSEDVRGAIKHIDRYKQLISYEGLERHRKITPTDIDGLIDYSGNAFILMECKLITKEIDYGQKLAIENVVNSLSEAGKQACCLLFKHDKSPDEIIDAKSCIVYDIYYRGKWHHYGTKTVLFYVEQFEKHWKEMGIYL